MIKLTYYLYNEIPGAHPTWTLAVLAVNQADADKYIRAVNHGGKRAGIVTEGKVNASCGAVTEAATQILRAKNREA